MTIIGGRNFLLALKSDGNDEILRFAQNDSPLVCHSERIEADTENVAERLHVIAQTVFGVSDCHNVIVRHVNNSLDISLRCTFDGSTPITQIHDASTTIEDRLKAALPRVERVLVHAEPE